MEQKNGCNLCLTTLMLVVLTPALIMGQDNTTASELRIAIPVREFEDWVRVERDPITGEQQISGFSIEVFKTVVNKGLPSPIAYKLIPFVKPDGVTMNGTFDDMLKAVSSQDYDGAVGEISVLFYRTQWVDFTLPYLDTQISMLVRQNHLPLNTPRGLSLASATKYIVIATLAFSFIVALLFWFLEYKSDKKASLSKITNSSGQPARSNHDDMQPYDAGDIMGSITQTRLMMILFFMVLLVLMACFASTQTSMFTSQHVGGINNLSQLIRKGSNVGYRKGSFVYNLLLQKGFSESKLIKLDSDKQTADMLAKGTKNGGVDAVIADSVNLQLFLAKYCNSFTIVPTVNLHSAGFGFAFRKGLPLANEFSQGILRVIDNGDLGRIQERTIGSFDACDDELNNSGSNQPLGNDSLWILIGGTIAVFILMVIILLVYCGFRCSSRNRKVVAYPCYLLPCC